MLNLKTHFQNIMRHLQIPWIHVHRLEVNAAMSILLHYFPNQETVLDVLSMLKQKHRVSKGIDMLVVVGDGKTYDILKHLQKEYSDDLSWLLPYPGEWHLLKNAQAPLFKILIDGGLRTLLRLYHHGATARSVENTTHFDKTHSFLLQYGKPYTGLSLLYF